MSAPRESAPRERIFERHPVVTLVTAALVGFVVLDIVIAQVLMATGVYQPHHRHESRARIRDPLFHHGFAPNVDDYVSRFGPLEYRFSTNSLALKDVRPRQVPLKSDGPRVLFIGDSFTEGVGLVYEVTFVGLVGAALGDAGVDVLNAGVSSYSPVIYRRKVEYLLDAGLEFDRLVVMVDISDILNEYKHYRLSDDNRVVDRDPPNIAEITRDWLSDNTVFFANVRIWLRQRKEARREAVLEAREGIAINRTEAQWTLDDDAWRSWGREGLSTAAGHMTALREMLARRGIAMTVVVYPWPDQIWEGDLDSRQVSFWQDWAANNDADFIDLFPLFVIPNRDPTEVIKQYYFNGDFHWNAAGHVRVAEGLVANLDLDTDPARLRSTPRSVVE